MYLITHGYYLSDLGKKTLTYASQQGNLDVVKKLIEEYKIDPNGEIYDCSIYFIAANLIIIVCLGDEDRTPLNTACFGGHLHIIKYLVEEANCDASK